MRVRRITAIAATSSLILGVVDPAHAGSAEHSPSSTVEEAIESYNVVSTAPLTFEDTDIAVHTDRPEVEFSSNSTEAVRIELPTANAPVQSTFAPDMLVSPLTNGDMLALEAVTSPDEAALSDGARALIALADESSPRSFDFPLTLPTNHRLTLADDGGVIGSDPITGAVSVIIPKPWAIDAEGKDVPTRYVINGDTVTQIVDTSTQTNYPVLADPLWFVPLIIAGGRVIGQVAIQAATRSAAAARAAAIAATRIVRTVRGKVSSSVVRRCGLGAAIGTGSAVAASPPVTLKQRGDGRWHVNVGSWSGTVSAAVGGCLSANVR